MFLFYGLEQFLIDIEVSKITNNIDNIKIIEKIQAANTKIEIARRIKSPNSILVENTEEPVSSA